MISVSFLLGCRNCSQSDGITQIYSVIGEDSNEYLLKTEFEVRNLILQWRIRDDKRCVFCDSTNVEVHKVEVNRTPLYDFESIVARCKSRSEHLFMLNIDKRGEDFSLSPGGSSTQFPPNFLIGAVIKILKTIKDIPDDNFLTHDKGNFFICVSGGFDFFSYKARIRIEALRFSGIKREYILKAIEHFNKELEISTETEDSIKPSENYSMFGTKFDGSMFTSWIHINKEEQANDNPLLCVTFKFDENTIVATVINAEESPKDFINNNQHNTFIVEDEHAPLERENKKIYFAKKI